MKKNQLLAVGLAAMFGFLVACATRSAMPTTIAQTLPPVANQYTECVAISLWVGSGRSLNEAGQIPESVRVPSGWTPVGGGARGETGREGMMILCR